MGAAAVVGDVVVSTMTGAEGVLAVPQEDPWAGAALDRVDLGDRADLEAWEALADQVDQVSVRESVGVETNLQQEGVDQKTDL